MRSNLFRMRFWTGSIVVRRIRLPYLSCVLACVLGCVRTLHDVARDAVWPGERRSMVGDIWDLVQQH